VWSEDFGEFMVEPQHITGLVRVLFPAFVTTDKEGTANRERLIRVGFPKWDLMSEHQICVIVSVTVLADHHPTVVWIFPCVPCTHRAHPEWRGVYLVRPDDSIGYSPVFHVVNKG
jgi:hypothetical protein